MFIALLISLEKKGSLILYEQKLKNKVIEVSFDNIKYNIFGNYRKINNLNKNAFISYKNNNKYIMQINENKSNYKNFDDFIKYRNNQNKNFYNYSSTIIVKNYMVDIFQKNTNDKYYLYSIYGESSNNYFELSIWGIDNLSKEVQKMINTIKVNDEKR